MKFFISLFTSVLLSQTIYQGSLDFSYDGSEIGSFSSSIEDTTSFGGALNLTLSDSSSFMMMGINTNTNESFNLFLTILQDTTYPLQPREWNWDITITDLISVIENPLSLPNLSIFVPDIDSSLANQWLTLFPDTSSLNDSLSLDILVNFFAENLLSEAYLATSGNIAINDINEQNIAGNLSLTLIKPSFLSPMVINIYNGTFNFTPISIVNLSLNEKNNSTPKSFTLQNAYPNPFNPQIKIPFFLKDGQDIKISILDVNGRIISILSDQYFNPGNHSIIFSSQKISSGIYFINIYHKNGSETQKITYLK